MPVCSLYSLNIIFLDFALSSGGGRLRGSRREAGGSGGDCGAAEEDSIRDKRGHPHDLGSQDEACIVA